VLEAADTSSAEGRDRALEELRPVLGALGPSVLREELVRRVAERLDLSETLAATLAEGRGSAAPAANGGPAAPRPQGAGRREQIERSFLALCLAVPREGEEVLARVRPDEHFTSESLRRAAAGLRGHLAAPLDGLPDDAPELARLVGELAVLFARETVGPDSLEHGWLLLELARIQRAIGAARAAGDSAVVDLARERIDVKRRVDEVSERIERAAS
jgi:DNA primase